MAEASIPVDLFNPGQVFACLGFLEAADLLLGDAEGGFDWSDDAAVKFHLRTAGTQNACAAALSFISEVAVSSVAPSGSRQRTEKWKVPTILLEVTDPFPFPDPVSPATLPALLRGRQCALMIEYWGEATQRTNRDSVKFWAGSGGYPGAALALDAVTLVRERAISFTEDPFSFSAPQSSSFRFDWRRDYIPIDVGFSPNDHEDLTMVGFPLVEIFAAIGLGNARPERIDRLTYRYGVIGGTRAVDLFSPCFLRAALGAPPLPFPQRLFRMHLGWPGQENQARCITNVVEETRP